MNIQMMQTTDKTMSSREIAELLQQECAREVEDV